MLSRYARAECWTIAAIAACLAVSCYLFDLWWLMALPLAAGAGALAFYRDPKRISPRDRNVAVSPGDGKVSSIHEVAHFEPFGGPAVCVRVFLSVFDVHVNYCPCHAEVHSIAHKPGEHMSVLNPRSAEVNESICIVFHHPTHKAPIIAVRQIAGLLARTVYCALHEGQVVQRGAKLGIMKLGSSVELYLPVALDQVLVRQGQRVVGAVTPLAVLPPKPVVQEPPATTGNGDEATQVPDPAKKTAQPVPEDEDAAALVPADLPVAPPPDAGDPAKPEPARTLFPNGGPATDTAVISGADILDDGTAEVGPETEGNDDDDHARSSPDLTDHAISHVMNADDELDPAQSLSSGQDGEFLAARMENAGTDLMLHPDEHGEDENQNLAESLAGLRPEADTSDDDEMLQNALPPERQPGVESPEDSGDWQIVPSSKKTKKPQADGLLWEEAP